MSTRSRAQPWFRDDRQLATYLDDAGLPMPRYEDGERPPEVHDCFWMELQRHEDMRLWYGQNLEASLMIDATLNGLYR